MKATLVSEFGWQATGLGMNSLDGLIAGRDFIVPNRFTISDIILYCALDFAAGVGQTIDPANANVTAWFKRIGARPSAASSLHPASAQLKMRG